MLSQIPWDCISFSTESPTPQEIPQSWVLNEHSVLEEKFVVEEKHGLSSEVFK